MKVAQNDETNPDMELVRPPHTPSISNTQLSPSGTFVQKRETLGVLSRMFPPPFAGTTYCRVRAHLAPLIVMIYFVVLCLLCIHYFFPLFSPVDYETDAAVTSSTTELTTPLSCQSNQASPPLDHQISHILLYPACRVV